MRPKIKNIAKRLVNKSLLFVMVAVSLLPALTNAQVVVVDPAYTTERRVQDVKKGITNSLSFVFFQAVMNSVNYFLQKAAYDTAVWVASGGKAQVPLFDSRKVGKYLEDTALDAGGEFVGTFSKAGLWQDLGLDLCTPTLPELKLRLHLGAINTLEPKPKCTFNQIKQNYAVLAASLQSGAFLNRIGIQFTGGGQSELGTALEFNIGLRNHILAKEQSATLDRVINKGYRSVTTALSDKVTTPADVVEDIVKKQIKSPNDEAEWKAQQVFLNKDVLLGAAQNIGNLFLKTLAGKLIDRAKNGFFSVNDLLGEERKSLRDIAATASTRSSGQIKSAQILFADLLTPTILDVAQYNPLNEYANCPEEFSRGKNFKTINSCVLDQGLLQAIEQKLTIRQAIDRGLLNGNWPLVPPQSSNNADPNCFKSAYCHGNLAKLRKLRVIPVGFEFAASISNPNNPVSLNTVLTNFNNCNPTGGRDATHPYCHLLDENWVLKYPETQCRLKVYGATLAGWDASEREEICVDTPSCIAEDSSGKCVGGFGYCTREKAVWAIEGDLCPAQFASCRTYVGKNGAEVSYLSNTLDKNACSPLNAGCLAYRTVQDTTSAWLSSDKLHLNDDAETCDLGSVGCSKLARASSVGNANLLFNGSFEEDANLDKIPDNWILDNGVPPNSNITPNRNPVLAYEGNVLLQIASGHAVGRNVPIIGNQIYTLAFWARRTTTGSSSQAVYITYYDQNNVKIGVTTRLGFNISSIYQIRTFTLQTPPNVSLMNLSIGVEGTPSGQIMYLDNVFLVRGETYQNVEFAYLKKAPNYLGCTGETGEPLTCSQYASFCQKTEVGCRLYQPIDGGVNIPGATKPEDACPSECVGYAAFTQKRSNFESEETNVYMIPATARSCALLNVGCSAFTNLSNEKVEYYTYLRACQKSESDAITYYTWEGSDTAGYQLKTWRLKQNGATGGPCTKLSSTGSCADDGVYGVCTKAEVATNPDCREFLDQSSNPFYRLYSKTIVVSDQCVAFRKTESDPLTCQDTGGIFDASVNACIYSGLPTENVTCPAAENNCRAFSGTTSGNVRQVIFDNFEDGLNGWSGGIISSESLTVGGHSMRVSGAKATKKLTDLKAGMSYTVTFWAKGTAPLTPVTVSMLGKNLLTNVSQIWRPYNLGPFIATKEIITFDVDFRSDTAVFIDNVEILERQSEFYSIVNSWTTPASCDNPVPQAQLGCMAYKTVPAPGSGEGAQTVYLKSFDTLCRPEKVGCSAFADVKNSDALNEETFNAVCRLGSNASADTPCKDELGNTVCIVPLGSRECRYATKDGGPTTLCSALSGAGTCRDVSTYTNPGDSYVYLVDDGSKRCTEDKAGCMLLGQEQIDGTNTIKSVARKINTANFNNQLCLAAAVACEEYRTDDAVSYFKNPGNKLCEWREDILTGPEGEESRRNGWYKKGTNTPCEPPTLSNNVYQIKRNADSGYAGFAGLCEPAANKCAEFIDPADTSENLAGQSYFYLKNDRITGGDCGGEVSQKEGCILFNDTTSLSLPYASQETYAVSVTAKDKVTPLACGTFTGCDPGSLDQDPDTCPKITTTRRCDSNTILKVRLDRQCGEWLACQTKSTTWDSGSGRFRDICLSIAPCKKFATTAKGVECVQFAPLDASPPLAIDRYAKRNVTFSGLDYSGYSIPNIYPLGDLKTVNISKSTPDWRLVKDLGSCAGSDGSACGTGILCASDSTTCLPSDGVCLNNRCVQFINGTIPENVTASNVNKVFSDATKAPNNICRGYPEKDSPFSRVIVLKGSGSETRIPGFANANICLEGECECLYQKVEIAREPRYYSFGFFDNTKASLPTNLCKGGRNDGKICDPSVSNDVVCPVDDAGNKGICGEVTKFVHYAGLLGRCVELDYTTRSKDLTDAYTCLTWYPVDVPFGGLDIYNLNKTATYAPATDRDRVRDGVSLVDYNANLGPLIGQTINIDPSTESVIGSVRYINGIGRFGVLDKLTIDGIENGSVNILAGTIKSVALNFYSWVDNDQTAITKINIDWGDGAQKVLNDGYYKNHKPYCNQNDVSENGGASFCRYEDASGFFVTDTNFTCISDSDCAALKNGNCAKLDKICQNDPQQACVASTDCKDRSSGSCQLNASAGVCAREDGLRFSNGDSTYGLCGDKSTYSGKSGTGANAYCTDTVPEGFRDNATVYCKDVSTEPDFKCNKPTPLNATFACSGPTDVDSCTKPTGPCIDRRFNGSSVRTCEPNPFNFVHIYACNESSTCQYSISVTITDKNGKTKNVSTALGAFVVP